MNDKNDKGSAPNVISSYRRQQARAERLLPFVWIGIMLLVVLIGYVIYQMLRPSGPQALAGTGTPTITLEAAAESTMAATLPLPTAPLAAAPLETPLPTVEPTPGVITYTVQTGDTLLSIATQHGIGLAELTALNPQVTPEFLNVGDELTIPASASSAPSSAPTAGSGAAGTAPAGASGDQGGVIEYTVAAGDTLAAIATRYNTTIDAIVRENSLASADQIQEGQKLRIPAGSTVPVSTVPAATQPAGTAPAAGVETSAPTQEITETPGG